MHRPSISLSVLMLFLGGGVLATSTVCGQLPPITDHCGGIVPFVDDDPWFPYAYPTVLPSDDGNRSAHRGSPWRNYESGCDPVYDQAVYGTPADSQETPVAAENTVAKQKTATTKDAVAMTGDSDRETATAEADEYVDFPYELTYDDDPPVAEASREAKSNGNAEPPVDYSEYDVYEPEHQDADSGTDDELDSYDDYDSSNDYDYDYDSYDDYQYDAYDEDGYGDDSDYGYDDQYNYDVDEAQAGNSEAEVDTDRDSLDPTDVGAEPIDEQSHSESSNDDDYGYDDEDYYDDEYGYDDEYYYEDEYGQTDNGGESYDRGADESSSEDSYEYNYDDYEYDYEYDAEYGRDDLANSLDAEGADAAEETDAAASETVDSADASSEFSDDEYEDFPYELTYDDDPVEPAVAEPADLEGQWAWLADDMACWLSHCRDRAMGWVCETGVEETLRMAVRQLRHAASLVDVQDLARMAAAAQPLAPEAPVAARVDTGDANPQAVNRWATVQTALMLDRIGESLQRVSRRMLLKVAGDAVRPIR